MEQYLSSYKSYPVRSEDEISFKKLARNTHLKAIGDRIFTDHDLDIALSQGIEIPSERVGFEEVDVPIKYTNGEYSRTIQMVKHAILLPHKESLSFPEMNKKDSEQHDHYMNHCQVCGKHKHAILLTEDKEGEGQEVTDDEIAQEARKRYPYSDDDTEARMNKLSSKRRRFIEGAKWMQFEIIQKQNFKQ